ncbi:MAG: SDR family oxidoreductase [Actinomycetota bacterium]|nr:SDR family oxidoreductase [Actinomycetota bacterium]
MNLTGKNAIVTGGGARVGKAISLALAEAGARVYIHYNSSADAANSVRDQIVASGGVAAAGPADLSDPELARQLISDAEAALGPISILVNNASGFATDDIATVSVGALRSTNAVSVESPVMLIQAMALALPQDLDAAVVNITDARTMHPYKKHLSYLLAKGAVDTLTRAAALDLAPQIRVNAVALGVILPPADQSDGYAANLAASLPLARVGGASVVADTVVFLCRNDFITGEIIRVDGGAHLQ